MSTEKIKAGYRFVIEDKRGNTTLRGFPASLSRIPNPPSAFVLTEDSPARMRAALQRHIAISRKQCEQLESAS